jgi:phosphoribosylglycinamide formyltransferase 1
MSLTKIAILASHGGTNMQAIMDNIAAGRLRAEITLVISNNSDSGAARRARQAALPFRHISARTHPGPGGEDEAITRALQESGAQLIVLAGYMKPLGPRLLQAFRGRLINIHPSLLPRHGGAGMYGIHPHEAALAAGDRETGCTVHLVTEEYDTGPILRQRGVPVLPGDTPETLQQRVLAVEHELFSEVLADLIEGRLALPPVG